MPMQGGIGRQSEIKRCDNRVSTYASSLHHIRTVLQCILMFLLFVLIQRVQSVKNRTANCHRLVSTSTSANPIRARTVPCAITVTTCLHALARLGSQIRCAGQTSMIARLILARTAASASIWLACTAASVTWPTPVTTANNISPRVKTRRFANPTRFASTPRASSKSLHLRTNFGKSCSRCFLLCALPGA